jgi:glycosyltransferase involved in cell wall biosynthesis
MDIVFYTSSLGNGGAEKVVQRIANYSAEEGHNVTVAVARGGGSYEKDLSDEAKLLILSKGWLDSSTWRLIRSIKPLRRYLSKHKPDIVFSAMDHVNVRLMRALSRSADKIPTVISVHNNTKNRFGSNPTLRNRLLLWRMKMMYEKADRVVAVSEGVANALVEMEVAQREQIEIIYNPCVEKQIHIKKSESVERDPQKSIVVACGSLIQEKGYSYLIDAFQIVLHERKSELWILGEGEQCERIKSKISVLGLEAYVDLLGFRDNPYKFMAAADVFVLSSLSEGFGNVIVEAMACGTPVVSTDCPHGPGEIITHGENGVLVPPADSEALAEALLRVLDDQALQERLVESGHERARDFHVAEIGRQYLELFREVVSEKSAPRPAPR